MMANRKEFVSGLFVGVALLAVPSAVLLGQREVTRVVETKASPDAEIARAAQTLYEGVRFETLSNGLRVYLKPIPGAPVVTTMVAYKVGSADEDLDRTGLSHYLEHLMFKGTDKLKPGDIDRVTLRNGGANNANTSEDCTIYHFDFAADRWEAALEIEADRMRNLRIDADHEFEQEKGAVISELERDEDEPWDLEQKAIMPLLFGPEGPNGHPVIGKREHVRSASAKIIKAHYDKWYHPNNASLVVCGGFDEAQALAKIKKLFGPIPKGELPERKVARAVPRNGPVSKTMPSKFAVPRMLMGFNTVRGGDPDHYALDVLWAVLGNGKTARLYRSLVEGQEIAASATPAHYPGRYPGWFSIQLELIRGKDPKKAEQLVIDELKRLREEPISEIEMRRVQRSILAGVVFQREGIHELTDSMARGVTVNDLDFLKTYLVRIAAVTPKDVQAAARKYFDPEKRVVIWSLPADGAPGKKETGALPTPPRLNARKQARAEAVRAPSGFSLAPTKRVVLDNGLTLLLYENHRLPIVAAQAHVDRVHLLEPEAKSGLATLMGRLLDEGSDLHTSAEIAEKIEGAGGTLSLNSNGGTLRVLAPDRTLGLELFFECLSRPAFPKESLAREREHQLSEIEESELQPDSKAQQVYRSLIYGKHPFGRASLGVRKSVAALEREDCQRFHRQLFVPNNATVAIVGDFDSASLIKEVTGLTSSWKKGPLLEATMPKVALPEKFSRTILTMPEAEQLHFYMGHVGITRSNPDYYKLLVLDYVLGTGPGFTDRLSARLRDRNGLAYTVSANITASAGNEPGMFTCGIGTEPKNLATVQKIFLEELVRIRADKADPREVEDAKQYLLGSMPFRFITTGQIAGQLLEIERYRLGLGYLDDYRKAVAAVTPADVQTVARKYLDPEHMILVVAGAIDAQGKPLAKLPQPKPLPK